MFILIKTIDFWTIPFSFQHKSLICYLLLNCQPLKQNFMLNCKKTMIKKKNCYKYCILWLCAAKFWLWKLRTRFSEVFVFWGKMKRLAQRNKIKLIKILFSLEDRIQFSPINVMSERVKMPVRHFLRSDYLHIFFSIKFLLFVSLVHQISI